MKLSIHSSHLATGIVFILIGFFVTYLGITNQVTFVIGPQIQFAAYITQIEYALLQVTQNIPEVLFLLVIILIAIFFLKKSFENGRVYKEDEEKETEKG